MKFKTLAQLKVDLCVGTKIRVIHFHPLHSDEHEHKFLNTIFIVRSLDGNTGINCVSNTGQSGYFSYPKESELIYYRNIWIDKCNNGKYKWLMNEIIRPNKKAK